MKRGSFLLLLLAAACGGGNHVDRAKQLHKEAIDFHNKRNYQMAVRRFTEAISLAPGASGLYDWRAASHEAMGENDKALADFGKAIEVAPDAGKAIHHFNRARFLQRRKKIDEAEKDFNAAVERQEKWPDPVHKVLFILHRALFYLETGRPDPCIADCEAVLKMDPDPDTKAQTQKLMAEAKAAKEGR